MLSVLLIEDNPADAYLVEMALSQSEFYRFAIDTRTSLAEGMAAIEAKDDYAIVMLDLTLPDSRGFETIERMLARFPMTNLVVMTGLNDRNLGLRAVKAGAQDFLVKDSFEPASLNKSLQYALARKQFLNRMAETQRLAHIGNWESDLEAKTFEASEEVYRLLRLAPSEKELTYDSIHNPENNWCFLGQMQQEALAVKGKVKREIALQNGATCTYLHIECQAYTSLEGHRMVTGFVQDVTERVRVQEMQKARDVAEQSARMKEQLLAGISHEMRTPMNAIYGMSNLLKASNLNDDQGQLVDTIRQSSQTLLGIINDILEISTLQNGVVQFDEQSFDLHETLQSLAQVMEYKIADKPVDLRLNIDRDVPRFIIADKLRLNQILNNLAGNAVKFTDEGSINIEVALKESKPTRCVLSFSVEDSGIGIPEDKLEVIFEAFSRVRSKDRLFEGTGLGLSIARNMIEKQGGNINVESTLGKGSKFTFTLDAGYSDSLTDTNTPVVPDSFAPDDDKDIHILLVEDHKMNQLVARKTLERKWPNCRLSIANNGQEALDMLATLRPQLILMDLQMPVLDGYETTQRIRSHFSSPIKELPILAMTANAHISKDDEFIEKGFDDYVLKPFEPDELFAKITKFIHRYGNR